MDNDIQQRAVAMLADTLGRTKEQMGEPEPDAYVTEVEAVRAIAAALTQQHNPCTIVDFFNGRACPECVTRYYLPVPVRPGKE